MDIDLRILEEVLRGNNINISKEEVIKTSLTISEYLAKIKGYENRFSDETIVTYNKIISLFDYSVIPKTYYEKNKWLRIIDDANRIDGFEFKRIIEIVEYLRVSDKYWQTRFVTLIGLRNNSQRKYS